MESADRVDLLLIRRLQDDPRATFATISRLTGISETTVRRRVEALIAHNIITPAMLPDLYLLGYRTSAMIGVKVDLTHMHDVATTLQAMPEVTFVALTTGRYDVLFFVAQPTLDDLTRFMIERVAPIEGIRETETLVTPRVLKVLGDWRVPLDNEINALDTNAAGT